MPVSLRRLRLNFVHVTFPVESWNGSQTAPLHRWKLLSSSGHHHLGQPKSTAGVGKTIFLLPLSLKHCRSPWHHVPATLVYWSWTPQDKYQPRELGGGNDFKAQSLCATMVVFSKNGPIFQGQSLLKHCPYFGLLGMTFKVCFFIRTKCGSYRFSGKEFFRSPGLILVNAHG